MENTTPHTTITVEYILAALTRTQDGLLTSSSEVMPLFRTGVSPIKGGAKAQM